MRFHKFFVLAVALLAAAAAVPAQSGVGLGVAIGATLPQGSTSAISSVDGELSFAWGFYVDIPVVATFHITPSSELYKLGSDNATDTALAFKFIVPLTGFDLYAGFEPGLTTVGKTTAAHVGIVAGGAFILVSNLDMFVQAKYKVLFEGNENIRVFHLNTGVLFRL
jgi:hypothetical protein